MNTTNRSGIRVLSLRCLGMITIAVSTSRFSCASPPAPASAPSTADSSSEPQFFPSLESELDDLSKACSDHSEKACVSLARFFRTYVEMGQATNKSQWAVPRPGLSSYDPRLADEKHPAREKIRRAWWRACDKDNARFCGVVGQLLVSTGEVANAKRYLVTACDGGDLDGCIALRAFCEPPEGARLEGFAACLHHSCAQLIRDNEYYLWKPDYEVWLSGAAMYSCGAEDRRRCLSAARDTIAQRAAESRSRHEQVLGNTAALVEDKTNPTPEDVGRAHEVCDKRCAAAANKEKCVSDCVDFCVLGTVGRTQCLGK